MLEMQREDKGKGQAVSMFSPGAQLSSIAMCSPTLKLMEASLQRQIDYNIGHWELNSISSSSPLPKGGRVKLKVPTT